MTFDDILAQIIDLLKRQGRVSYSALKRRFDLDDDYLNDLKDELLFAHPVVDEDHRGLVWTGDTASGEAVAPQPAQPTPQPAAQEQPSRWLNPVLLHLHLPTLNVGNSRCCSATWSIPPASLPNSIPKSTGMWCVRISRCVPTLSSSTMGMSPNCSVT